MKKTISLVLVAAMLLCTFAIAPVTTSAATLDANNVAIEATRFNGRVDWVENYGNIATMGFYDAVTIKGSGTNVLTLDGTISDGEWDGAPVYTISSEYAANNAGQTYDKNVKVETPSAENSYFYYAVDSNRVSMAPEKMEYTMRFMWDEQYLYIAAVVAEYDGHRNNGTAGNNTNWDGDALQFRVDPNGPNAIVNGTGYDASVDGIPFIGEEGAEDTSYCCTFPWSADYTVFNNSGQETYSTIGNFVFSYSNSGYTDMCDAAKKYKPTPDPNDPEKTIWNSADISEFAGEVDNYAYATVVPKADPNATDGRWGNTTYEIAVPWELIAIDGIDFEAYEGRELGFASVLFDTARGQNNNDPRENTKYYGWLEWGSGICGHRTEHDPQTCGGSNSLTLVNTSDAVCEHEFAEATCILPETCVHCGYQRGFVAGHKYVFSNATLPTTEANGYIFAECSVCGDTFDKTIPSRDLYDYRVFSTGSTQSDLMQSGFSSGYTMQWEELNEEGKRADTTNGEVPVYIYNKDQTAKCSFNTDAFGYATLDMTIEAQTGTYFDGDSISESYAHKMDVYFTDLHLEDEESTYNNIFGQWFGGGITGGMVDYAAGLVMVEDVYYWAIYPSSYAVIDTYEQLEEVALCIQPATDKQLALNKWHEFVFMIDDDSDTAMLFWDDQLVAAASDYHFDTPGRSTLQPIFRSMNIAYYMKDIHYGSTSYAAEYVKPAESAILTLNGEAVEYNVGEEITLNAEFYVQGGVAYRFNKWIGDVETAGIDAAVANQTFAMPGESISLEAEYIAVGDLNNDGMVTAKDLNVLKRMVVVGADYDSIADINNDGLVSAGDVNLIIRYSLGTWTPNK